jgi:hypothetical protein
VKNVIGVAEGEMIATVSRVKRTLNDRSAASSCWFAAAHHEADAATLLKRFSLALLIPPLTPRGVME